MGLYSELSFDFKRSNKDEEREQKTNESKTQMQIK